MSPTAGSEAGWDTSWPAPAKLNLFLHVIGRRADGYHLLQTAFQFLDYGDEIRFEPRDDGSVSCSGGPPGLTPGEDLAVRAAKLLRDVTGCRQGIGIQVEKRVPTGGGLGGGSSDAATVLVALNALWALGLGKQELAELGARLGADVPVFVYGRAAWGEGVGERLTPVAFETPNFLVIRPPCEVSTRRVFEAPALTRNSPPITISGFLSSGGRNDCLEVVRSMYPAVGEALDWLSRYGEARLTGTGACVYAAFEDHGEAQSVLARIPAAYSGFVARGLNESPLLGMV